MEASFYPYLGALCWIGILLMLGTLIRAKVPLFQKLLFPSSLIGGLIGFVLINLDLVGMPTSTGWKDITPNIFSMITCSRSASWASVCSRPRSPPAARL